VEDPKSTLVSFGVQGHVDFFFDIHIIVMNPEAGWIGCHEMSARNFFSVLHNIQKSVGLT
jgi:hypothetical protein